MLGRRWFNCSSRLPVSTLGGGEASRSRRGESGQSAVEFAIVLPVLVLIALGILDLGLVFSSQLTLNHAAAEGARLCARRPGDTSATRERVAADLSGVATLDETATACPSAARGDTITVTAVASFVPMTRAMAGSLAGGATGAGAGTLRLAASASAVVW